MQQKGNNAKNVADSAQKVEDMAGGLLKGMMTGKDVTKVMNVVSVSLISHNVIMIMLMMLCRTT